METKLLLPLLSAGVLAGLINFFVIYVNIPFKAPVSFTDDGKTALKDIWWIALLGYIVTGCGGSFLTLTINALIGTLKVLDKPGDSNYYLVLFGYGVIFGYSTTRLLVSLIDMLLKKVATLEDKVAKLQATK